MRVLVVDDDETVRRILTRQITRLGHHVDEAGAAAEALQLLRERPYQLLCTDLGMPGMSGWELIERARQATPGLRILLITGWGEQIEADEARMRGADAVVSKPFDALRLGQLLHELQTASGAPIVRDGSPVRPHPRIASR
jgi:CheY-like chemotaxis protein